MLKIYTDAGFSGNIAYATTIILRDNDIASTMFSRRYEGVTTCAEGEVLGIKQGLEWAVENCPEDREVTLYCDNLGMAQKLANYASTGIVNKGAYTALWLHIYSLCDKFDKVDVHHIISHQSEHNPNKACDFLCHALLRQECTQ